MGARRNFSMGGNVEILLILFWLLTMQSNVFYTSAIRNAFSFHKLPNINFCAHFLFLQLSHDLRIIDQNNMSGKKSRELYIHAKLFQAISEKWNYVLIRLS